MKDKPQNDNWRSVCISPIYGFISVLCADNIDEIMISKDWKNWKRQKNGGDTE